MVMYTPFRLIFRWYFQQQAISYSIASPYQSCTVVNRQMVNHGRQLNISSSQGSGISKSKADNSWSSFGFRLNDIRSICSVSGLGGGILKFLQRGGGENYSTPLRTRCMVRRSSNQKSIELGPSLTASSADLVSFSAFLGSCKRLATRSSPVRSWVFWTTFSNDPSTGTIYLAIFRRNVKRNWVFFLGFHKFESDWLVWQSHNLGKACRAFQHCVKKSSGLSSRSPMSLESTVCPKQPITPSLFDRSFKLQNTSYSPRYKLQRRGQNNPN